MTSVHDTLSIGSVVFALIDPSPGHEIDFNHWYERDHYYTAGAAAPGVFSAGRYIAPRYKASNPGTSTSTGLNWAVHCSAASAESFGRSASSRP